MSLQVWLPLIKNLNNQGCGVATISAPSTTFTLQKGKIGNASYTASSTITVNLPSIASSRIWSVTFWAYAVSANITANWTRVIRIADGGDMFRVEVCPSSYNSGQNCYSTHNNAAYKIAQGSVGSPSGGYYDQWFHMAITCDGTTISVYHNGTLRGTQNYTGDGAITGYFYIENSDKTYKNDFRIYDECLSPKQVKEISKGLVCHYPLDNNGSGMPNLVPNQGKYYSESTAYVRTSASKDGNAWLSGSHFIVEPSTTYTFSVCSDGNLAPSHDTSGKDPSLKLFTMWLYLCNSDTTKNPDAGGYDNPVCFTSANYNHQQIGNRHIWQYTTKSTETHMSVRVNNYSDGTNNLTIKYWQIKIEKSNAASPWCPNSTDALYSIFNINSNKEIDISGYGNHGTKSGTITYNSDTPRYSTSTVFNGSNTFIACGRGGMVKDAITISLWAYQSSWSSFTRPISCTEGGGWNFEASGNYISFQCGTGTSSNTYKPVNSQKTYASLAAGWHMFTATYDGLASKIYIDGVLDNTATSYTTKTPIFYNSSNGIFIGAEAGGNQTTPAGTYFNGRISDVRIYATALSADDIKELYQVSASIDNKGNILGYEFDE